MLSFIILTRGRTGSTLLCDELNRVPGLFVEQELLREHASRRVANRSTSPMSFEDFRQIFGRRRVGQYFRYLDMWARGLESESFGFKVLTHHVLLPGREGTLRAVRRRKLRVIRLHRNPILRAISGQVARARGVYNAHVADTAATIRRTNKVVVNVQDVVVAVKGEVGNLDRSSKVLNSVAGEILDVHYENFVLNRGSEIEKICLFLGVGSAAPLGPPRFQQSILSISHEVVNLPEVLNELRRLDFVPPEYWTPFQNCP